MDSSPPSKPTRFLIVRIAALGDVARATTLVTRIRDSDPTANVTWVVGGAFEPLLREVPGIDRIVTVDERRLYTGHATTRILEVVLLWLRLAAQRFDTVILAHPDPRYDHLVSGVRRKRLVKLATPTAESKGYIGDEFAALLGKLSRPGQFPLPDLRSRIEHVAPTSFAGSADAGPLVVLAPGGAKNVLRDDALRRWPVDSYAQLARQLIDRGYRVALVGAETDAWVRPAFGGIPVQDLIGTLGIPQLLRVLRDCDVVVTHDTGPLHLAQLVRARAVSLFGPTIPERVIALDGSTEVLWGGAQLACRPCYDGREFAVCSRNLCMEDISVASVVSAIDRLAGVPIVVQLGRRATE